MGAAPSGLGAPAGGAGGGGDGDGGRKGPGQVCHPCPSEELMWTAGTSLGHHEAGGFGGTHSVGTPWHPRNHILGPSPPVPEPVSTVCQHVSYKIREHGICSQPGVGWALCRARVVGEWRPRVRCVHVLARWRNLVWKKGLCRRHQAKDLEMGPLWTRVALSPLTGVLTRDGRGDTQTQRSHVKTEAKTGRTWPQAQGCPEPRELEEAGGTLPGASGGSAALRHLNLGLGVWPQNWERTHFCSFQSKVCGPLSQQPQDPHTAGTPEGGPCPREKRLQRPRGVKPGRRHRTQRRERAEQPPRRQGLASRWRARETLNRKSVGSRNVELPADGLASSRRQAPCGHHVPARQVLGQASQATRDPTDPTAWRAGWGPGRAGGAGKPTAGPGGAEGPAGKGRCLGLTAGRGGTVSPAGRKASPAPKQPAQV